jgi:uncharacterized protein YjbI with pentapeptide repeats
MTTAATPAPTTGLKELLDAANEAAKREATQWFYFVTLMVYLAAAVGGVTHRKLFLAEPVTLPIFNVALPLTGFFIVAPAIFVVLHFYSLAQLRVMTRKVEAALARAAELGEPLDAVMLRLDSFAVAQMLAGRHVGRRSVALAAMAWITLIIAPVGLLLFFQIRFLPYHDAAVTWVHRVLLAVDLALLWWLWPRPRWSARAVVTRAAAAAGTVLVGFFALVLATVPGEWADDLAQNATWEVGPYTQIRSTDPLVRARDPLLVLWDRIVGRGHPPSAPEPQNPDRTTHDIFEAEPWPVALRRALFDGPMHPIQERATSLFSRFLFLPHERFVPSKDSDFADLERTLVLRGRDLRGAVLFRADLRKADLTGAQLQGASLENARLHGADFGHAQLQEAFLYNADVQGAWLTDAKLQGAWLVSANLQGARLDNANLQGAWLNNAQLQGVALVDLELQGANLSGAQLQGANLRTAQLQGADLTAANLQGAALNNAQLQGANLTGAQLQGATLAFAKLQGAILRHAQLEGAALNSAQVWRSNAEGTDLTLADMTGLDFAPLNDPQALIEMAAGAIPPGFARNAASERLAVLTRSLSADEELGLRAHWPDPVPTDPPDPARVASLLGDLACAPQYAPHIAELIARQTVALSPEDMIKRPDLTQASAALARRLLDAENCPGARGLSEWASTRLRLFAEIRP